MPKTIFYSLLLIFFATPALHAQYRTEASSTVDATELEPLGTGDDIWNILDMDEEARIRKAAPIQDWIVPKYSPAQRAKILSDYNHLDPKRMIQTSALENAVLFYDANRVRLPNSRFMTLVDFNQHSGKRRFFIVDMVTGVVDSFHTAHGRYSDRNDDGLATDFGNVVDSGKSSVGFAYVAESYTGKYGYSARVDGLSATNSNLRTRAVVIHPSSYVYPERKKMGRSLGCWSIDKATSKSIIDRLRDGSLLYSFYGKG